MTTVYIVSRGDYSDYRIISVHARKADAKRVAKALSTDYSKAHVEEHDLLATVPDDLVMPVYGVRIVSGEVVDVNKSTPDLFSHREINKVTTAPSYRNRYINDGPPGLAYYVAVRADDEDHARKIAQDLVAEHKAKITGITD